jgi:transcriptional regulator with XRE-family HTH domain
MAPNLSQPAQNPTTLGQRLRALRVERNRSQEKLARAADISTYTYNRIESDRHLPNLSTFLHIAAALGVSPCQLLGEEGSVPAPVLAAPPVPKRTLRDRSARSTARGMS